MKIFQSQRKKSRTRVFPLRISLIEEQQLRTEAKKQQKSIAELIRNGYILYLSKNT